MVKNGELFIVLFVLFLALLVIFNARWFIKNKVKKEIENIVVNWIKIISYLIIVACLFAIYFIR